MTDHRRIYLNSFSILSCSSSHWRLLFRSSSLADSRTKSHRELGKKRDIHRPKGKGAALLRTAIPSSPKPRKKLGPRPKKFPDPMEAAEFDVSEKVYQLFLRVCWIVVDTWLFVQIKICWHRSRSIDPLECVRANRVKLVLPVIHRNNPRGIWSLNLERKRVWQRSVTCSTLGETLRWYPNLCNSEFQVILDSLPITLSETGFVFVAV